MPSDRPLFRTLAAALAAAVLAALPARAEEPMSWLMLDFPPASIVVNGKPGDGMSDQIVKYLISKWPRAEHRFVYANPSRVWTLLAAGEHMCLAGGLRTPERERLAYLRNVGLLAPPQVILRAEALAATPLSAGKVDAAALMRIPALRGVVIERRAYGTAVDALLSSPATSPNVVRATAGGYRKNIFKMLTMGSADYTIDYDFTLAYEVQQHPELAALKIVPVLGADQLVVTSVACPRTPWGLAAIERIDRILATPEGATALAKAQYRWMTPDTLQRYQPQMDEFFRKLARADPAGFK